MSGQKKAAILFFDIVYPSHDFHPSHGGKPDPKEPWKGIPGSNTKGCEGEGLMSYGSKTDPERKSSRPDAWSSCSNTDFIKFYRKTGHRCLRRNGNVDDDVMLCNSKIIISAPL